MFRNAVVKGENIELLLLVKEEDRVYVNLTNLDLHFTESPSLYESGERWPTQIFTRLGRCSSHFSQKVIVVYVG